MFRYMNNCNNIWKKKELINIYLIIVTTSRGASAHLGVCIFKQGAVGKQVQTVHVALNNQINIFPQACRRHLSHSLYTEIVHGQFDKGWVLPSPAMIRHRSTTAAGGCS